MSANVVAEGPLLRAFRELKRCVEEEESSIFCKGFATPAASQVIMSGGKQDLAASGEHVAWAEVQNFIQMAEQALKVRTQAIEALSTELAAARSEKCKVEKTSSAAQEESSFLTEHMQSLLDERQHLKEGMEKAQREKEYLVQENQLLRQELLEGAAMGEESSAALQLLARQSEELRAEKQKNMRLENESVQLQARVSALERANTAQATAMLSCLEDSERVRLQQTAANALQQLSLSDCDSPLGPLSGHLVHSEYRSEYRSDYTDDSAFADAQLELGSDSGSFVSCITPHGSSSGGGGRGNSVFHSLENSPERSSGSGHGQQQRQALLMQQHQQRQTLTGSGRLGVGGQRERPTVVLP